MVFTAGLVAILLPLLFLYIIYALDLYSSGNFRTVVLCFVWGLIAFGLALGLNTAIEDYLLEGTLGLDPYRAFTLTVVLAAPVAEEILKSLALLYYVRRPDLSYFVDGAIYGFAAGIGFSVLENLWYMSQPGAVGQGLMLVVSRAFSTCLMHGSASALVGISIGRFQYGHGRTRLLSTIAGWAAAISLHVAFNSVVEFAEGPWLLLGVVGLGVGGTISIALFIRWGLAEEKRWLAETLGKELRVSRGEKALVLELQDLADLLRPVQKRCGEEKAALAEQFLVKQAQLGIKQKSSQLETDPQLKQQLREQIDVLQGEIHDLRRKVGIYCMTYVRSIVPLDLVAEWRTPLMKRVAETGQRPSHFDLWGDLQTKTSAQSGTESDSEI